jgi:hypothetical protein
VITDAQADVEFLDELRDLGVEVLTGECGNAEPAAK